MSDASDFSLRLMQKRKRRAQFKLRRRRYLGDVDMGKAEAAGLQDASPRVPQPAQSDQREQEWAKLRAAMNARLAQAESRANQMQEALTRLTVEVEALKQAKATADEKFEAARRTVEESKAHVLRARAEMDSQRKRLQREREDLKEYAAEEVLRNLLPVVDNLALVLRNLPADAQDNPITRGFVLVQREVQSTLENVGLRVIDAVNCPFDPAVHDAVSTIKNPDVSDGIVVGEARTGYLYKNKVLRPAMVTVNKLVDTPVTGVREGSSNTPNPSESSGIIDPSSSRAPLPITPRSLRNITGKPVAPPPQRPTPPPVNTESVTSGDPSGAGQTPENDSRRYLDTDF